MTSKRQVGLLDGFKYQGDGPMLAWMLHRISGLGIATFVSLHILASFFGGDFGKFTNGLYESWEFQVVVFFCVFFHAINGLRITIVDLWPKLLEYQREAIWVEWAVFLPVFGFAILVIVNSALGG
jgi:succinate dehydrogenase / fumarate reductase cytochrome b subunit